MANIGQPLRRVTVVPLKAPVVAPEEPKRSKPVSVPSVKPAKPELEPVER